MLIRKMLFAAAAAAAMLVAAPAANAYVGDWYFADIPGEFEVLHLGDNTDGSYLRLGGTGAYCVKRGVPYATIRNILVRNGTSGQQINWWIDEECTSGYVRICVENSRGESACSTYTDQGWR